MTSVATPTLWGVFFLLIAVLLALDLGVIHRRDRKIGMREAVVWSIVWTLAGLAYNAWLYWTLGRDSRIGLEFLAAYVIERSLSFDNIFVFIVLFNYFAVPQHLRHRVLYWGILGALLLRGVFIAAGAALIAHFHWLLGVFGAFLLYTGIQMFRGGDLQVEPESNPVLRFFRRFVPMTADFEGRHFVVRRAGRLLATPLLLVLVVLEATDLVFAVDSIPAVFGVTRDSFIAFTSNIFAILGLRALYSLLESMMTEFRYLSVGLGVVLAFVGAKMLADPWYKIPTGASLAVVVAVLALAVTASLVFPHPRERSETPDD